MADEKKTLEMRVAELEDKLAQVHISEDEMATFHKVAAKLGTAAPCTPASGVHQSCIASQQPCVAQQPCIAQQCVVHPCIVQQCHQCTIFPCIRCIIRPIVNPITWADCIPPCAPGNCATGGTGGAGFGGLGG
jgi:hypothetical protein